MTGPEGEFPDLQASLTALHARMARLEAHVTRSGGELAAALQNSFND